MGGILDHTQVMPLCDVKDGIHIARATREVNGDDRLCPGGDPGLDIVDVDVEEDKFIFLKNGIPTTIDNTKKAVVSREEFRKSL